MKILVLGGSYFYGRVFIMLAAKKHEITVLNRGTYSMEDFGVKQMKGDRHDEKVLGQLAALESGFDAVVDFCGYAPGDVASVAKYLPGQTKQYIFISTVDVYERGIKGLKNEETPYESRSIEGEAGEYIHGKIALEQELKEVCLHKKMAYTILRPAILYGPYNYAPRESVFIRIALENHLLPEITDAAGKFQFTYVRDGAEAIEKCLLNEKAYGQAYNLCGDEILDYGKFITGLEQAVRENETINITEKRMVPDEAANTAGKGDVWDENTKSGESGKNKNKAGYGAKIKGVMENGNKQPCKRVQMTAQEAAAQGIPLPFAVYEEETELYSNEKSKKDLGMVYTPFQDGMNKTYRAFKGVFG